MKAIKTNFFILFMMISSVSFAQVYEDFDTNMDGTVDRDEFNQTYTDSYSQWDQNQDGQLDDREFYETNFNRMDADRDGTLSNNEWNDGYDDIYGEYLRTSDYEQFDENDDGMVSSEEFYTGMSESDFYTSYDTNMNGRVDQDELNQGVFDNWDEDRDGTIDRNEYDAYSSYYIDF